MTEKIYLRKDGRYSLRYKKGIRDDGSIHYGYIYGKDMKEILKKKEILKDYVTINKSLFSFNIYIWLKSVKISCKMSTYSIYEYICNAYLIPNFGKYKKKEINKEIIINFTEKLLNKGLKPKTVKDILIILKQVLKYANIDIDFTMPKIKKKEIQILTKNDQKKLEAELSKSIDEKSIGLLLSLYTGLRIGEICALKWKNIDLKNKLINIEKTLIRVKNFDKKIKTKTIVILDEPKSISSIRTIPIPNFILPILKNLKKEDNFFLLTGSTSFIEPRCYANYFKKIINGLNLKKYNFHALRHTFATRCIESGFDPKTLSEILGHSDVKITLDRYVHPSFETKIKMMNNLYPMCSFNKKTQSFEL